jgi:hypothetical protein
MGRHSPVVITPDDEQTLVSILEGVASGKNPEDVLAESDMPFYRQEALVSWLAQEGYLVYPELFSDRPENTEKARDWLKQRARGKL